MRPLIGITTSFNNSKNRANLSEKYYNAIERAGATPHTALRDKAALKALAERLDVILSGDPDIDPSYFQEMPHPQLSNMSPQG